MREVLRRCGGELYRGALSLLTLFLAVQSKGETARIAPFAFWAILLIAAMLMVLPRTRYVNLPFLQLTLLLVFCYDSFDVFVKFAWLAPIVVAALCLHLYRLRPRLSVGPTFLPLCAVALATVLGGLGTITAAEYFSPMAIGYVIMLGPGLLLVYWILKNEATEEADAAALRDDLFWWGLTAACMVLVYCLPHLVVAHKIRYIQWSNNVSTMLMLAMPAAVARIKRTPFYFPVALAIPVAMMCTGSRAGALFAWIEFFICLVWVCLSEKRRVWRLVDIGFLAACIAVICTFAPDFIAQYSERLYGSFFSPNESRWRLLRRGWENFQNSPLLGTGLGYLGNADLYNGRKGTVNWYHVFPAQVIGSFGLLGALSWGWQLFTRFIVALKCWRTDTFVCALSYLGLLMMSMVNPGEFCPVPYAFLAVYAFAVIENRVWGHEARLWLYPFRRKETT